jgi:hypothetical protein
MEPNIPISPGSGIKKNRMYNLILISATLFALLIFINTFGTEEIDISKTEIEIYPSEAPVDYCFDSGRNELPSTGEGYANWFFYGSCGGWKIYDVTPEVELELRAHGDECQTCPSCTLGDINYHIYDYFDDQWNEMEFIDGPDNYCGNYIVNYSPVGNKIKIVADSGFYMRIYQVK